MTLRDRANRINDQLLMFWKRLLSFRKREWDLTDYPVLVREQELDPNLAPRFVQHRYVARVLGWWHISAGGATRNEALVALDKELAAAKLRNIASGEPLPRPGIEVPIKFGAQDRVNMNAELAQDFIHRVLQLPWAFVSDESSLWNFHSEATNDALIARIKEIYGVDVSDIESANLSEILVRIAATQQAES